MYSDSSSGVSVETSESFRIGLIESDYAEECEKCNEDIDVFFEKVSDKYDLGLLFSVIREHCKTAGHNFNDLIDMFKTKG